MGWNSVISLVVLGSQVKLLILFIFIAIVFAAVLIFFEFRVKHKKTSKKEIDVKEIYARKILRYKKIDKNPEEKLDLLDSSAKSYFKETFNLGGNQSYSSLIEKFEALKEKKFVNFSNEMFSNYYGSSKLEHSNVDKTINLFVSAIREKGATQDSEKVLSIMDRIDKFIEKRREVVLSKRLKEKKSIKGKSKNQDPFSQAFENEERKIIEFFKKLNFFKKIIKKKKISSKKEIRKARILQKRNERASLSKKRAAIKKTLKRKKKTALLRKSSRRKLFLKRDKKSFEAHRNDWNKHIKKNMTRHTSLKSGGRKK